MSMNVYEVFVHIQTHSIVDIFVYEVWSVILTIAKKVVRYVVVIRVLTFVLYPVRFGIYNYVIAYKLNRSLHVFCCRYIFCPNIHLYNVAVAFYVIHVLCTNVAKI